MELNQTFVFEETADSLRTVWVRVVLMSGIMLETMEHHSVFYEITYDYLDV